MVGVILVVVHPFNFFKAEIRLFRVFPEFVDAKSPVTVPVYVLLYTFNVNVFAVFYIKPAIIVPWIVGFMFAGTSVVPCQFQFFSFHFHLIFRWGRIGGAVKPADFCVR